jgi:hypothetical protein
MKDNYISEKYVLMIPIGQNWFKTRFSGRLLWWQCGARTFLGQLSNYHLLKDDPTCSQYLKYSAMQHGAI